MSLRALITFMVVIFLSACTPSAPQTLSSTSTELPTRTDEPVAANFTPTLAPTNTITPRPTALPTPTSTAVPAPLFCTPLEDHTLADLEEIVTQAFKPPPAGKDTGHHGVDFAYFRRGERLSIAGVHIQSVLAGRAAAVIVERIPYGNMIIIETPYEAIPERLIAALSIPSGQSLYVLYAHMAVPPLPSLGAEVACGEMIGEVGNTPKGWSSDPHLHLEARYGPPGVSFADMNYYDNVATEEQMANYERWRMSGEFVLVDPLVLVQVGLSNP